MCDAVADGSAPTVEDVVAVACGDGEAARRRSGPHSGEPCGRRGRHKRRQAGVRRQYRVRRARRHAGGERTPRWLCPSLRRFLNAHGPGGRPRRYSRGLPPFLTPSAGANSGSCWRDKWQRRWPAKTRLAHAASVDTIPGSGEQGKPPIAVRKLRDAVSNVRTCLAVETLRAAPGVDPRPRWRGWTLTGRCALARNIPNDSRRLSWGSPESESGPSWRAYAALERTPRARGPLDARHQTSACGHPGRRACLTECAVRGAASACSLRVWCRASLPQRARTRIRCHYSACPITQAVSLWRA
jgi:hypothetical protein